MSRFKIYIIAIHVAGWLLFMAFPLLFLNGGGNSNNVSVVTTFAYWLFCGTYIALFLYKWLCFNTQVFPA